MDVCLSLRRADHSSRDVQPTAMRRMWSRNLKNEETMARVGSQRQGGGGVAYMINYRASKNNILPSSIPGFNAIVVVTSNMGKNLFL